MVLVPVPNTRAATSSWQEDAFLVAVPATMQAGGRPLALAVDPARPWRPELADFLRRLRPDRVCWLGPKIPPGAPAGLPLDHLACTSTDGAAAAVIQAFWKTARQAVAYDPAERGHALAAAALAARIHAPLLPCPGGRLSATLRNAVASLDLRQLLAVGSTPPERLAGVRTVRLPGAQEVARWLDRNDRRVDYLAATNPNDLRNGPAPRLSLAAVILAAGRQGAVVPLPYDTVWKRPIPTTAAPTGAPPGAPTGAPPGAPPAAPTGAADETPGGALPSRSPRRLGKLEVGDGRHRFVTGSDPQTGQWRLQVDRNGDGDVSDDGEGPFYTGSTLRLDGRTFTVDLDADEKARGQFLWLTWPSPARLRADLTPFRKAAARGVTYLCLVGWPEDLPMAIVAHGQGIDGDQVSDLPLAQTDADPFVELAMARFVAEDCATGTLVACRGLVHDAFPDRSFERRFATAEWGGTGSRLLQSAGLEFAGHHAGKAVIGPDSPLTDVQLISHGAHSMWTTLGKTYACDSTTLLAPCLVMTGGCSTGALDQDGQHRSVAARLLRNGAIGFLGNTRRVVAQESVYTSEALNALLDGATLGKAHRTAWNRLMVAAREKGQTMSGLFFYQLHNHTAYGDPAIDLGWQRRGPKPARVVLRGSRATIYPPERWLRDDYATAAEWGSPFARLFLWRAPGVGFESWWHAAQKRNAESHYFHAEVHTRRKVTALQALGKVPQGLGWSGRFFVDEHADGTCSIHWRTRLLDADMTTGEVHAEAPRQVFHLQMR